jgi:crotonobetaine/carnitine-CoA ligase
VSSEYRGEWVMSSILEDRAERLADRVALHTADGPISYEMLRDRAQRVAGMLVALGVKPGDRVATMIDPNPDYLSAWFGCAWAGAVEVPVNTEYKGEYLRHVLDESEAAVLILQDRYVERLARIELNRLKHVIVVGEVETPSLSGVERHRFRHADQIDPLPLVRRREQDLLYILYTSGTTGLSKGVVHCNRSALWTARVWQELAAIGPDDVGYSYLPLYHVTARSALIKPCILAGGSAVVRDRFSVNEFWPDIRRHSATFTMYMGSVILFLVQQEERADDADNSLRVAGGAACPPAVGAEFERRFGCRLLEVYGMTEVGTVSGPRGGNVVPGTMGRPFDHIVMEIHDEDDRALPPDTLGEIVMRPTEAYAIMQGYWRQPQATVEAWRNLWFHSGDIGKMTPEGELVFVDRLKDSIRRRGENVSSFEVERSVQTHQAVQECAAFAVASEATEDEVMIAVVLRPGHVVSAAALLDHCEEQMPRFAVPRFVRIVLELPKTPTGRVQKHVLRKEGVTPDTYEREVRRRS